MLSATAQSVLFLNVMSSKLAIIGGSGLYALDGFEVVRQIDMKTPFGAPSDQIVEARCAGQSVYFLPRHGRGHRITPTNINFRANIDALKQLGVTDIVSVSAVGSLKEDLAPGKFVLVDQFIDRTFKRKNTFFDDEIAVHVSMAQPTSSGLMDACEVAVQKVGVPYQRGGVYVVIEGPHFSTRAESHLYRSWGADVIGMTNMPEAKLAREAEIRYATLAMVTDFDCWHPAETDVDGAAVVRVLLDNAEKAKNVLKNISAIFDAHIDPNDPATNCLDVAVITAPEMWTDKTRQKLNTVAGRVLKS